MQWEELLQSIRDSAQASEQKARSDRAQRDWQRRKRRLAQQQPAAQQPEPTYRPGQRYRSIDDP